MHPNVVNTPRMAAGTSPSGAMSRGKSQRWQVEPRLHDIVRASMLCVMEHFSLE